MSQYKIECISLEKQFTGNKQKIYAVNGINLRIKPNETVVLKGRSGAGKSTLLNLMCGLIKPTMGKVLIDDRNISELSREALSEMLSKQIGIIFQSFNLLPTYTVYENIEIGLVPGGIRSGDRKEQIISLLKEFGLHNKAQMLPPELSTGQQQKVAVVRTLIKQPSIIFADEPTGSVDDQTAEEINERLMALKNENRTTIVIATHGNIPERFADNVYMMEDGYIKEM